MERNVLPLTWIVQNHIFSVPAYCRRRGSGGERVGYTNRTTAAAGNGDNGPIRLLAVRMATVSCAHTTRRPQRTAGIRTRRRLARPHNPRLRIRSASTDGICRIAHTDRHRYLADRSTTGSGAGLETA